MPGNGSQHPSCHYKNNLVLHSRKSKLGDINDVNPELVRWDLNPTYIDRGPMLFFEMGTEFPQSKEEKMTAVDLGVKKEICWVLGDGTVGSMCYATIRTQV